MLIAVFAVYAAYGWRERQRFSALSVVEELRARFVSAQGSVVQESPNAHVWWINDQGYSILIPATENILLIRNNSNEQSSTQNFSDDLTIARKIFRDRGFFLNKNNSSTSTSDKSFYDYVEAYEHEDERCTLSVNPDLTSYSGSGTAMAYLLTISCGNTLASAEKDQIPFLDALNYRNKGMVANEFLHEGEFSALRVDGRRAGEIAIVKKEGSNYRVLFVGQDSPSCELIAREHIPSSLVPKNICTE